MVIYVETNELGEVTGWASARSSSTDTELEISEDAPFLTDNPFIYKLVDGVLIKSDEIAIANAKQAKDKELNLACKGAILDGFAYDISGVTYWFSYDYEAQGNFRDAKEILTDGVVNEIVWTVRVGDKNGAYDRITIDLPTIQALSLKIMEHKTGLISRYRDELMPLVNGATTLGEVEAITW